VVSTGPADLAETRRKVNTKTPKTIAGAAPALMTGNRWRKHSAHAAVADQQGGRGPSRTTPMPVKE